MLWARLRSREIKDVVKTRLEQDIMPSRVLLLIYILKNIFYVIKGYFNFLPSK